MNQKKKDMMNVFTSSARPTPPNALTASWTFAGRALLKIKHVPEQLFDITAFPVIFLLMYTYLFGGAIAGSPGEYLQYLLPGILAMTVVMITMYTGIDLNKDVTKGVFDRFRTLPVWLPSVLVGAMLVDAVRYTVASTIMVSLGLVLGFRPEGGFIGVLTAVGLLIIFSVSLSWIWTMLGLIMRSERSLMGVSMMVMFPLTFMSNAFIDPNTLPSWLQGFVEWNPISILVSAIRGLMHGVDVANDIWLTCIISVAFTAIFAPITMALYRKKK
ncbi:ABC transporter permease [Shouchella lonarensis]|uniref:Transport permease protein n=1 Tax=Shouchella lonarensis TaxID=1464122 RepID=A0A1G6LV44_9BACI|nr:ABC transporter permease [Shouchella lonarensis]SDC47079.1 ABC-2 type transport system permease protein [Shouchella lonarensis]